LGLEQYEPAFRENRIGADLVPSSTPDDLKDLGISLVGDRRRLLDAISCSCASILARSGISRHKTERFSTVDRCANRGRDLIAAKDEAGHGKLAP
jgi:hypothetical protein